MCENSETLYGNRKGGGSIMADRERIDDYIHEVELRHGSSGSRAHGSVEYTDEEIEERRRLIYGKND